MMDAQNEAMDFLYNSLGKIVPDFSPARRRLTLAYLDCGGATRETDVIAWHSSYTEDKALVSALRMEARKRGWTVTAIYEAGSGGSFGYLYYAPRSADSSSYPTPGVGAIR